MVHLQELIDDLPGFEVGYHPHPPGGAELAVERAAYLRRQAGRAPGAIDDQYGLNSLPGGQRKEEFDGLARGRFLTTDEIQVSDVRPLGELFPQNLGDIGHLLDIAHALGVEPIEDLTSAVPRFFELADELVKLVGQHGF